MKYKREIEENKEKKEEKKEKKEKKESWEGLLIIISTNPTIQPINLIIK